jgi:hypothetical protein
LPRVIEESDVLVATDGKGAPGGFFAEEEVDGGDQAFGVEAPKQSMEATQDLAITMEVPKPSMEVTQDLAKTKDLSQVPLKSEEVWAVSFLQLQYFLNHPAKGRWFSGEIFTQTGVSHKLCQVILEKYKIVGL